MSKHKHYQYLRAAANGWKIQRYNPYDKKWYRVPLAVFADLDARIRIEADKDGWIPFYAHEDSKCPVDPEQRVEVQHADNKIFAGKACETIWVDNGFHNITRYRPYKIEDEYQHLKEAQDRGEIIQENIGGEWQDKTDKDFISHPNHYRVKPYVNPFKALREAHERGDTIQVNHIVHGWVDIKGSTAWLLPVENYRIKPKTKKLYQWLLLNKQFPEKPEYYLSDILYETEADIKKELALTTASVVKRIDNSMVEIEVEM